MDVGEYASVVADFGATGSVLQKRNIFRFYACPLSFQASGLQSCLVTVDMASFMNQHCASVFCVTVKVAARRKIVGIAEIKMPARDIHADYALWGLSDPVQSLLLRNDTI